METARWLFGSLFLGGFECSTHLTVEGHRLDMIATTQHDIQAQGDYELCRGLGFCAVRESARWHLIDRGGKLDLDGVRQLARLGRESGLIQIWDLMHYGYPDDLDPFSLEFCERFARYVRAVATVIRAETVGQTFYTPINEISYNAWASGQVGYMAPFARERGDEYKRALVRAAIAATNAIWEVDPDARMFNVDPLVRMHAPKGRPDLKPEADHFNQYFVTEAFDMLAGRVEAELGGSRRHLGIVGLNYYEGNQWTIATPELPQHFLGWREDPEWIPLADLLLELQTRYGAPIVIAETGAAGDQRANWLKHLTQQVKEARERGVDVQGICWYPLISSPDWEDPTAFFDGGLFDVAPQADGSLKRVLARPVMEALREAQTLLDPDNVAVASLEPLVTARAESSYLFAQPLERARFKADNFAYQTLLAGEELIVELYSIEPGFSLPGHKHEKSEHVLTIMSGNADIMIGKSWIRVLQGETVLVPAGLYHGIHNYGTERLVVQQVSSPKPWDARFRGPHPSELDKG